MWVFVATEVGKERPKIAEGEKQCRQPPGRERETAGRGGGRAAPGAQVMGLHPPPKSNARRHQMPAVGLGKAEGVRGSSPAQPCSSSSILCPAPGPGCAQCRLLPGRPASPGPRVSSLHEGRAKLPPRVAAAQPRDSPGVPVPPWGSNGSPGFATRSQWDAQSQQPLLLLILLLLFPRSSQWAPRCHVPVSLPGSGWVSGLRVVSGRPELHPIFLW